MVHQNRTVGLQLVLVNKRHDRDIVFRPHTGRNNGVVLINKLFKSSYVHGQTSQLFNLLELLIVFIVALDILFFVEVLDELFFDQKIVLYAFELQLTQTAFCDRSD